MVPQYHIGLQTVCQGDVNLTNVAMACTVSGKESNTIDQRSSLCLYGSLRCDVCCKEWFGGEFAELAATIDEVASLQVTLLDQV